jgi:TolB-like protein
VSTPSDKPGLLAELKRRNVIRMAGLYLVAAWLITQVATTVLPLFGAPGWMARSVVVILAIGFIPALVFAWAFELTPTGIQRDEAVDHGSSIAVQTGQRMNRLIIAGLVLALAYFGFDKFVLAPRRDAALVAATTQAAKAATKAPAEGRESIAVLPFLNLSPDPENEFFSDGLSEEILNSLARIDGMQVVGRTSSFQFKGKNEDLRTIGQALGVATVLEGSVRREGNRARITAQLIRTSDGIHLWSQSYDRTLDDTLAVQLDIAEQVAGVLEVVLDDTQRARMRKSGLKNVDAFIAYQHGLKLYEQAHQNPKSADLIEGLRSANAEFDKATQLEPGFSAAYYVQGDLDNHILLSADSTPEQLREAQAQALDVLQKAADTTQDPQLRLITRVERQLMSDDWTDLAAHMKAAMDAPGCNAPNWLPVVAGVFGEGERVENLGARVYVCDPLNRIQVTSRITSALSSGNPQRVIKLLGLLGLLGPVSTPGGTATLARMRAELMLGHVEAAREVMRQAKAAGADVYDSELILDAATGGNVAALRQSPAARHRANAGKLWQMNALVEAALAGDRAEANKQAAILDARPAGGLVLAVSSSLCLCGSPFDLEATPNFRKRLAEGGLPWPPKAAIQYPTMTGSKTP